MDVVKEGHQPVGSAEEAERLGVPSACVAALESMQDCLYGDMPDERRKFQVCAAQVADFSRCIRGAEEEEEKKKKRGRWGK